MTPSDERGAALDPPPMGKYNDTSRTCSRDVGGGALCGKPATEHVIYWWDDDPLNGAGFDHGFCCGKHWAEYKATWKPAGHHALNAACGMPGSLMNREVPCWFDELPVAEVTRAVAVVEA